MRRSRWSFQKRLRDVRDEFCIVRSVPFPPQRTRTLSQLLPYWVWGSTYRDMKADRDEYRDVALEAAGLLEKHVAPPSSSPIPEMERASAPTALEPRVRPSPRPSVGPVLGPKPRAKPAPASTLTPAPGVKAQVAAIRKKLDALQAKSPKE